MIYLKNDYSIGAHPQVMEALVKTNLENTDGYGSDHHCDEAKSLICRLTDSPDMHVHFLMGGTQTNLAAIASFLRPHQAVISADTGHICVHEVGAVEATGHKVIHIPTDNGKLRPEHIEETLEIHEDFHWVQPKLIYISNLTETGIFYTKKELTDLRKTCDKHGLYIYLDGARLPMALTLPDNDLTMKDLPRLCDAFYIGGTKCGLLFGEALCIVNDKLKEDTNYLIKQRGGVMAKGRLLGVQFKAVFKNNLYFTLGEDCNKLAAKLVDGIKAKGYEFDCPPCSNMIFPIFPNTLIKELKKKVMFEFWKKFSDNTSAIRLVTSWATKEDEIEDFLSIFSLI